MKYEKINLDRLGKLALYLRAGTFKCEQLYASLTNGRELFDIEHSQIGPIFFLPIMELPLVFPKEWEYDRNYRPTYKLEPNKNTMESVILFFGLNRYIYRHLFRPGSQMVHLYGGRPLSIKPSAREISENIYELIDVVKYLENVKGTDPTINLN